MRTGVEVVITMILEAGVVYLVSKVLGWAFVDLTFFLGLGFIVLAYFFSSKGGYFSNATRLQVQAQSGIKVDAEKHYVDWNPFLVGSIVYTAISVIVMIVSYWGYFTK